MMLARLEAGEEESAPLDVLSGLESGKREAAPTNRKVSSRNFARCLGSEEHKSAPQAALAERRKRSSFSSYGYFDTDFHADE
jgi:hypothetical protein